MKIVVVGSGLVGGSIGLAARSRLGATVVGVDPDPAAALAVGAIDAAEPLAEAMADADAAFVATPVAALAEAIAATLAAAPADCVVSDVGSVKRAVVDANVDERFVGGHPLAGGEASGAAHAREDLFDGATWYLTPSPTTSGLRLQQLHDLLSGLGARPAIIEAATHDRVMAAISHLPHVIANVLVESASEALGGDLGGHGGAGPSFRDATRVAGANPMLWGQIYDANREALLDQVDAAIARLNEVRGRLADGHDLTAWQAEVGRLTVAARREDAELRMVVPNRPGVVAEVALALAREGINIGDMSLSPSPDMASGSLSIWVAADRADRAAELLAEHGLTVA